MTFEKLISIAIHDSNDALIDYVLWNRTPFPFETSPKVLFKFAAGYRRACLNNILLCELCPRPAMPNEWTCQSCRAALDKDAGQ